MSSAQTHWPNSSRKGTYLATVRASIEGPTVAADNTAAIKAAIAADPGKSPSDAISDRISALTKGRKDNQEDRALAADQLFRKAIHKGVSDPAGVAKSLSPQFSGALNLAIAANPQTAAMNQFVQSLQAQLGTELGKDFTLSSPLSSGLVPFDLVAPARLIYPVYSPFRNMVPRVPGQGTSHRAKVITEISGSMPGHLATPGNRVSISELPGGGSMSNWPNQLPGGGSQTAVDVDVPYRFFGLTEAVSWVSQFAGQGFEDIAGLASLVLLQEAMLLEEKAMIGSTSIALAAPAAPTLSTVSGGSLTETVWVKVTAVNYYGETAASAAVSIAATSQNVQVTIAPVPGALAYNVYAAAGSTQPASLFYVGTFGGTNVTISSVPTSGATPPAADTGTAAATDYEGFIPTISGHSAGSSAIYPAGFQGSYVNQAVGDVLSPNVIDTALQAMWNGPSGIFADPDDLWVEGTDVTRLAHALSESSTSNYRLFIGQPDVGGAKAGLAVDQYLNPITRKVINLRVHPYFPQGTAALMTWKLPQPWSNVSNVWENVMVQDYLSISWPVIDVTFRYSLFWYGALFSPAVQYNGLLQGLQASTPSAGGSYR